ncbi:MAG: hypothetical protein ACLUPK_08475 [Veillonella sp.]
MLRIFLDHFELTPYFDVIVGANYEAGFVAQKRDSLKKLLHFVAILLTDENGRRFGLHGRTIVSTM